jgi:parvulin-like peptidyl-prolyl isomerase
LEQTVEQLGDDWSKMPEAVKQQSLKEHRQRLERRVLLNKVEALAVASAEAVTEEDLLEEYEAHPQRYQDPEAAHLLHILIKVAPSASAEEARQSYEQATRARERIASGEPFTAVARELSEDIYREAGGDLGFVERGQFLQGQLDEAAFALQDGELSAVILSLQGYHILFRVESRTPRRHSIEEARDKILASLLRQRRSQAVHDWEGHLLNAGEVLLLAPWADPEDVLTAARPKPAGR